LKLKPSDMEGVEHMEHNLKWLEKTLSEAKFTSQTHIEGMNTTMELIDYAKVTKALTFVKADLYFAKRQLEEILNSDLMRQASTFIGAEQAQGRWLGQLSVVLEMLGEAKPEDKNEKRKCPACKGEGIIVKVSPNGCGGTYHHEETCPLCKGRCWIKLRLGEKIT